MTYSIKLFESIIWYLRAESHLVKQIRKIHHELVQGTDVWEGALGPIPQSLGLEGSSTEPQGAGS
jgi:hypothetical protein